MKIKTSELQGAALDWAVALAAYQKSYRSGDRLRVRDVIDGEEETIGSVYISGRRWTQRDFAPSTDWSQCGPLIEGMAVMMQTFSKDHDMKWQAKCKNNYGFGKTPLIAACRAIVSAKLGDEVDVPEELA